MAAVAAASAELLIIGWYIFRVLLQVFLECCIYWVGFAFRNPPGTQPIARSEAGGAGGGAGGGPGSAADTLRVPASKSRSWVSPSPQVFRYSLQKLAYTVSRTGRHVLGERRQRAPN
ncbi:NNAT [Cervus elaphus hippelaphus]|uniref:Neuronatin n=1 Tax=Cervus elaphus hippelaphus TaxID=46360 RepID=A0A212CB44_CEREH|nr:NNAT [Cervus elaphus hippelaphus]